VPKRSRTRKIRDPRTPKPLGDILLNNKKGGEIKKNRECKRGIWDGPISEVLTEKRVEERKSKSVRRD